MNSSRSLADLSPGYFALVMATGILSLGFEAVGRTGISLVLLVVAAIAYVVLVVLYVLRSVLHPARVRADLGDPEVAFSYFTVVAGSGVLATRLVLAELTSIAIVLIAVAAALWFVFGYVLPWRVLMEPDRPSVLPRVNGTWFVWSVASQSLAITMSVIQPALPALSRWLGILAVLTWSVGIVLYVGIAVFVVLRLLHHGLTPQQVEPPYWVSMGALAIAVVAGASIVDMESTPMVDASRSVIAGTVVIFWCFAAWLIPMLLGAGLWRHLLRRVPLRYTPGLWSMVFPLGMFAVASIRLGRVDRLPAIEAVGGIALAVATLVWALVLAGMTGQVVTAARRWAVRR